MLFECLPALSVRVAVPLALEVKTRYPVDVAGVRPAARRAAAPVYAAYVRPFAIILLLRTF